MANIKRSNTSGITKSGTAISDVPNIPIIGVATNNPSGRAYNNGSATVAVSSADRGGAPTSYTVTSSPGGYTGSGSSPVTVTGLQSNTSYTFTAVATNSTGSSSSSSASNSITATTTPDAPAAPTPTNTPSGRAYNNGAASISFSAPTNNGGSAVTGYTVISTPGSYTATGATSPLTVTGLQSNTGYTFAVAATNANGTGSYSSNSGSITATTVPEAPVIQTVSRVSNTSVSIPFTINNGGSAITSLSITSSPSIALSYSGTTSPITVTGSFAVSQGYTFTMTATNANGTSLTSLSSNSVTPLSVFSRNITFASTPTANFQVRVVLNTSNFSYTKANSSGNDLRFASSSSSTSYYDYWIESWNYNGTSVLWVEIPSAGTTSCVMTYGDSSRAAASSIDNTMDAALQFMYYSGGSSGPFASLDGGGQDVGANIANYNWGSGTVIINGFGSRADNVSIRWKGWVKPSGVGAHNFYCTTDDGSRVQVGSSASSGSGSYIINTWVDQGPTEYSGSVTINDGLPRFFQYEWFETGGGAYAAIGWQAPGIAKSYPISSTYWRAPKYGSGFGDSFNYAATVGSEY